MFGLSTASLILYGLLLAGGGGGVWYVMDLRSDKAELIATLAQRDEVIADQNKAVQAVADASASLKLELAAERAKLKPAAAAAKARIEARKAIAAPDSCDAAIQQTDAEK